MADSDRNITLYHYDASPFSRKIVWYLALRQIPYAEVKQPITMPRPDLQAIGVAYRRIPLMTIGKDVYCDTRIMLRKLEELFPEGRIGATTPEGRALQKLLDIWHNEAGLFMKGAQSLPLEFFKNEKFSTDRQELTGRPFSMTAMEKLRPESLMYVQSAFSLLEDLLSDDRKWLLNTEKPSQGDIEGTTALLNSR
jgi:glutathione S-transferase